MFPNAKGVGKVEIVLVMRNGLRPEGKSASISGC